MAWRWGRIRASLDDGLHVGFLHFVADFVMDDEAAATVEDGAEEVESAGDVEITDVDVPVLMRRQGLDEAFSLFRGHGRATGQQSSAFEHPIDAGGTASDDVGIEHHEGEPAITFQRIAASVGANAFFFVRGEPVVAWHPGVVLVDLAEAAFPVVDLAGGQTQPSEKATSRDAGLVAPGTDEIDDLVAGVVGHPAAL